MPFTHLRFQMTAGNEMTQFIGNGKNGWSVMQAHDSLGCLLFLLTYEISLWLMPRDTNRWYKSERAGQHRMAKNKFEWIQSFVVNLNV